ncbi:hypothetical protein MM817_02780 [Acidibacillus sp. S0AB]|uniref:Uncharacterized protein n=1 Tax=Sulfoacidibacillus ferrooxidans TaxID=2005001 RepID=A0A9X1VE47_9BACL|nr:hypothetical protein [Sulfoacidibacillus ferrooxidans]
MVMHTGGSIVKRYPLVWRLWISRFLTANAAGIGQFSIQWLATTFPNPAFALGYVNTFGSIGSILSSYIFGWLSDNFSPSILMVAGNVVGAVFTIGIGFLLRNQHSMPLLLILVFLWNVFIAITRAASRSLVPQTVDKEDLPTVNAWMGTIAPIQQFLAKGFAGILIATGLFHAFLAAGIVMFLSVFTLISPKHYPKRGTKSHKTTNPLLGLHIVWSSRLLRQMVIYTSVQNFGFSVFLGEYVLYLKQAANLSATQIGVGLSLATVGTVLSLIMGPRLLRSRSQMLVVVSPVLIAAGIAVVSLDGGMGGLVFGLFLLELGSGFANQTIGLIRQRTAPLEFMGSATGALTLLHSVLVPVAMAISGLIAVQYGTGVTMSIAWIVVLISVVFAWGLAKSVQGYLQDTKGDL